MSQSPASGRFASNTLPCSAAIHCGAPERLMKASIVEPSPTRTSRTTLSPTSSRVSSRPSEIAGSACSGARASPSNPPDGLASQAIGIRFSGVGE